MYIPNDSIRPQDITVPTQAKITFAPDVSDTVTETTRTKKDGSGKFKQYSLFIEYGGEPKEIKYLMRTDLRQLKKRLGNQTEAWNGQTIMISSVIDDKDFSRWVLE